MVQHISTTIVEQSEKKNYQVIRVSLLSAIIVNIKNKMPLDLAELDALPWLPVPGFEDSPDGKVVQVKAWKAKLPQTRSWCYVPLI